MESSEHDRLMDVIADAAELPAAERTAFLDRACGEDSALRREADRLLSGATLAVAAMPTSHAEAQMARSLEPPEQIGPYRIIRELGHGGMGAVYLAMQQSPVRRPVAIKLLLPGMDTREVLARFESERQSLALMSHPNVAQVFDAGATELGRPYFVMEYVDGVAITEYCDSRRLTTVARIELFLQVCQAVEHAHQKAIIHRDIKPSNVLVMEREGVAIPKVIDFGIAKATAPNAAARTLFTEHGQLVGTPEYMSPEQASGAGTDIDTRSDVYCLGVLLYELLTGTLPFDRKALRESAYEEIRRIIREVEPPKPSTRLSAMGPDTSRVADARQSDPGGLLRRVRGDLDWITMRAMEKDRGRRYGSPAEMAEDLRRHLRNEAVLAGPPTTAYRVRKFVRRHRAPVAVAVLLALSLIAGIIATSWQAIEARRARDVAQTQRKLAERRFDDVRELAGTFIFEVDDAIQNAGPTKTREILVETAQKYLDQLSKESAGNTLLGDLVKGYIKLGNVHYFPGASHLGNPQAAAENYQKAMQISRRRVIEDPNDLNAAADQARAMLYFGQAQSAMHQLEGALQSFADSGAIYADLAKRDPQTWRWQRNIGLVQDNASTVYRKQGDGTKALAALKQCEEIYESLAQRHPDVRTLQRDVMVINAALASLLLDMGRAGDGITHARRSSGRAAELLLIEPNSPSYQRDALNERQRLCEALLSIGHGGEPAQLLPEVVQQFRKTLAGDPSNYGAKRDLANSLRLYGAALGVIGRFDESMAAETEALALRQELLKRDPGDWQVEKGTAELHRSMAMSLRETGRLAEARDHSSRSLQIFVARLKLDPENGPIKLAVSFCHRVSGEIDLDAGQVQSAIDHLKTAAVIYRPQDPMQPGGPGRRELMKVLVSLGEALSRNGDRAAVSSTVKQALDLSEAILSLVPQDDRIRCERSAALLQSAEQAMLGGDRAAAEPNIAAATVLARQTLESDAASINFQRAIARCLELYGDLLILQNRPAEAAAEFKSAVEAWTKIRAQSPELAEDPSRLETLKNKANLASKP